VEVKAGASYTPYYYHADGLGSITGLSDATGTMVQTYGYDAFGNVTISGSVSQPFMFTGREYDAETSMYFYRARYYDPVVGRFVTKDPIGFAGGDVNLYNYVAGNPISLTDPDGLRVFRPPTGETLTPWAKGAPRNVEPGCNQVRREFCDPCNEKDCHIETIIECCGLFGCKVFRPYKPRTPTTPCFKCPSSPPLNKDTTE